MRTSVFLVAALCLFGLRAWAQEPGGEPEPYPEWKFTELLRKNACKPDSDGLELKDIPFSTKVVFRKQRRETAKPALELIRRWAVKLGTSQHLDLFGKDLRVEDASGSWWVAVPSDLITMMERELDKGDSVWFFMSFVGCAGGEPVFALEEYQPPDYDDLGEEATSYIT
jgi:hypothetical protein